MKFVQISLEFIMPESSLGTNIFLWDQNAKERIVVHYAGTLVDNDKYEGLDKKVQQGALLQILYDDVEQFCEQMQCEKEDIIKLNSFFYKIVEKEKYYQERYSELAQKPFLLKTFFNESSDFKSLLEMVKAQVMCFPLTVSDEVSLTIQLVEKLFIRDIFPVRCAVMSYCLARLNKIEDPETLSAIILASLFKDIGLTQINRQAAILDRADEDEMYQKHPMLSLYVLSKLPTEFSSLTKRLILEHHEQESGEGFPRGKKDSSIHFLSYYIQAGHILVGLVSGRYQKREYSWNEAFNILVKERSIESLNTSFPHQVKETIRSLQS